MNWLYPQARQAFQDKQKERQAEPLSARTPTLFASHIRLYSARIFGPLLESSLSLLPACPGQRQTGGNHNVRLGKIFGFQLLGDCRKGQHIIILVLDLVWCKFLVPLADEIIPAAVDQHIRCKQWLVVIGGDAGGKAAMVLNFLKYSLSRRYSFSAQICGQDRYVIAECSGQG